jgi:AcrR family transcriptional regulator
MRFVKCPQRETTVEPEEGRSERKKREARERIVAAAAELFIQKGSSAVSMDEVAESSDVARRTLFNYFASKDELLYAVAAPVLTEAIAFAEETVELEAPRLDDVIGLCLSLWKRHGKRLGLIYAVELRDSPRLAELHSRYLELFRILITRAAEGEPRLSGNADLAGKLVYRTFLPLLLALQGEEGEEERFARGLKALVESAAGAR